MYSDLLESSSKDNFSFNDFNDQSSSFDMTEVNEINNPTNLDYIFDSYYSTVSNYNTNFDLPEDCKNMSFSELFDQELFSTHENKDCKLTIKIEKEEPLSPCYSAGNLQDTTVSHSPVKNMENILSATSSKSFAPKRGINRTSIKVTKNCDVERLIQNPFYESENLDDQLMVKVRKPIIKCEPIDLNDLAIKPSSANDSQNKIDSHSLIKVEDNTQFSLLKNTSQKHSAINISSIKNTKNEDIEHLIDMTVCESDNLGFDQIKIPIIKRESEEANDLIDQDIKLEINPYYSSEDSQNQVASHSLVKKKKNVQSSLLKSSSPKHLTIHKTSLKNAGNNNNNNIIVNLGLDQTSTKIKTPIIKREPEEINDIIEQEINIEINPYSTEDSQNRKNSHSLMKKKDDIQSSFLKSSIPKRPVLTTTSLKIIKHNDYKNLKNLSRDQTSIKIKTPIIKHEPEEINDIIEQEINMEINPHSTEDSKNQKDSHSFVKIKEKIQSSLFKSSIPKRPVLTTTSLKIIKHNDYKNLKNLSRDQTSIKIKTPIIKHEPEEINDIIEQEINMEINPHSTEDSKNQKDSHSFVKIKEKIQSSLFKSYTPKLSVTNKTKNSLPNSLFKSENMSFEPMSEKMIIPYNKSDPENINDILEQDIKMQMKQCFSYSGSQSKIENCNNLGIKNNSTSKDFTSKHLGINHASLKTTENSNVNRIVHPSFCKLDGLVNDQATTKIEVFVNESEIKGTNDTVDQNSVGMEIHLKEENSFNEETSKYTGLEDFCCNNLNCSKTDDQKIAIKKKSIVPNITSEKNDDIETIGNDITLETEKKKISWEEYKAKVGKIGLSKISEDNDEHVTDIAAASNDKLETVKEEFDRNTAEYFIGQKRKIEDKGQQSKNAKQMNSEEDQELQNKRMKIEYIKKLLPSSFASEIAKTSSLMKGNNYVDDTENESTSDDSIMFSDKTHEKMTDTHLKKDEKSQKKFHQTRVHSSHRSSSKTDYCNKNGRLSSSSSSSSSSNPDDYYNRNRIDVPQNGQYNQNIRNTVQRSRDQKRVVYVGQIPIKFGKRYLYNRFKMFGTIQSLTLHKKPDFRVYYAFVTYSEKTEAERAINHGNDDESQVQLDIRFGERKQTQTPYYDLDDEWLTDWYGYNQPVPVVRAQSPEKTSFEEELQEFYKLAQSKKSNQIKSSQVS